MKQEEVLYRLGVIRYLLNTGVQHSQETGLRPGLAVLAFHDCVEMFFQLAREQEGVEFPHTRPDFLQYWEMKLPGDKPFTMMAVMRNLNDARVAVKHRGSLPTKHEVSRLRERTEQFLEENTPLAFGCEFREASLAQVVRVKAVRLHLQEADQAIVLTEWGKGLEAVAYAFADLMAYHKKRLPLATGALVHARPPNTDHKLPRTLEERLQSLESMLLLVAWGIDYPRYVRFQQQIPSIRRYVGGPSKAHFPDYLVKSREACLECYDFVVDCALQLQEPKLRLWRRTMPWGVVSHPHESLWEEIPDDEEEDKMED